MLLLWVNGISFLEFQKGFFILYFNLLQWSFFMFKSSVSFSNSVPLKASSKFSATSSLWLLGPLTCILIFLCLLIVFRDGILQCMWYLGETVLFHTFLKKLLKHYIKNKNKFWEASIKSQWLVQFFFVLKYIQSQLLRVSKCHKDLRICLCFLVEIPCPLICICLNRSMISSYKIIKFWKFINFWNFSHFTWTSQSCSLK